MKTFLLSALLLAGASRALAQAPPKKGQTPGKATPVSLVEQQLNAYNTRDIDAFLAAYADSVEIYSFPNKLVAKGKAAMRRSYSALFNKAPNLHCEIKGRLIRGNTVIDNENITGLGGQPLGGMVIYQVEDEKIRRVYLVK